MKKNIKTLLKFRLNEINQNQLTIQYFKTRVPFLRDVWHEVEHSDGVQIFTDQINHPDARIVDNNNNIITFKKFVVGVNFEYSRGLVSGSDDVLHTFKMEPNIQYELNSEDELTKNIHQRIMFMNLEKIGVNESIRTLKGGEIPDIELDKIVNNLNKTFFVFEEFLSHYGV